MTDSEIDDPTLPASSATQPSGLEITATVDAHHAATDAPSRRRAEPSDEWQAGDRLGRYTLLSQLGEGGMGVVWEAQDSELERRVAIKRLHPEQARAGSTSSDGPARLLREAQAMARLSHPNVLPVFDFGESGGDVFLAMELVEGVTLKAWLRADHSWRVVVRMFAGAGRGLAAAHAGGVVHRDFKPANVLVGADGRPRVVDFGLARAAGDSIRSARAAGSFDSPLTQHGDVMGTPLYMSPEQLRGDPVDERSDQYGFCASLWEGLYGRPPTSAEDFERLRERVERGDLDPPRSGGVPARFERILRRGLSPDATKRYPSMSELLRDLEHDPAAVRWKIAAALVIVILVGAAGYGLFLRGDRASSLCATDEGRFSGVWDHDTRARVLATVRGAGGDVLAERAADSLDRFKEAWQSAQQGACEDTRVRKTHTERQLEARTSCLDRRFGAMRNAVADLGSAGDPDRAASFLTQIAAFEVTDCEHADPDRDPFAGADEQTRADLMQVLDAVERGTSLRKAKDFAAARPIVEDALSSARALGNEYVIAHALTAKAGLHQFTDEFDPGLVAIDEAIALATKLGGAELGEAQLRKMEILSKARRYREALALRASTEAAFDDDTLSRGMRASVLRRLGHMYFQASEFSDARVLVDRAISTERQLLAEAGGEAESVELALESSLGLLASIQSILGETTDAVASATERQAIRERWFGPNHPVLIVSLRQLAGMHGELGNTEQGIALTRRALEIAERTGASANEIAVTHRTLGLALAAAERPAEALDSLRRALELQRAELGDDSLEVADSHMILGMTESRAGAFDDADASLRRAMAIFEAELGREHQSVAFCLVGLGNVARERGDCAPSLEGLDQAVGIMKRAVGTGNLLYAIALAEAGGCRAELGDITAIKQLTEVLAIYEQTSADAGLRAATEFDLARAVLPRDPARARSLATGARARIADSPTDRDGLEKIDAWLADHQ